MINMRVHRAQMTKNQQLVGFHKQIIWIWRF